MFLIAQLKRVTHYHDPAKLISRSTLDQRGQFRDYSNLPSISKNTKKVETTLKKRNTTSTHHYSNFS